MNEQVVVELADRGSNLRYFIMVLYTLHLKNAFVAERIGVLRADALRLRCLRSIG